MDYEQYQGDAKTYPDSACFAAVFLFSHGRLFGTLRVQDQDT
jgi:hypothetical protein